MPSRAVKVIIGLLVAAIVVVSVVELWPSSSSSPPPPPSPVSSWSQFGGSAVKISNISAGSSSFILATTIGNQLMYYQSGMWQPFSNFQANISNVQALVACGKDGSLGSTGPSNGSLWVCNSNGAIYKWTGSGFALQPGYINVGANGASLGIDVSTSGNAVASTGNNSYYFAGGGWTQMTALSSISLALSTDGKIYGVSTTGSLQYSINKGVAFTPIGAPTNPLIQVSCADSSRVYALDNKFNLYRVNTSAATFTPIPGPTGVTIKTISVGKDCVVLADSNGQSWINSQL